MEDQSRQLAGSLLGQLAEIIGVSSPVTSNSAPSNLPANSPTISNSNSERSDSRSSVSRLTSSLPNSVLSSNILSEARELLAPYPRMLNAATFRMIGRTPNRRTVTAVPSVARRSMPVSRPW